MGGEMKIIVFGASGKMGKLICKELVGLGHNVFEVDKLLNVKDLENVDERVDLLIDFSVKSESLKVLRYCEKNKIKLIMGTTGQGEFFMNQLKLSSKSIPIIKCDNFSENILKFRKIVAAFSKSFNGEIAVIETHHKYKADMPSGTSRVLISDIINQDNNKTTTSTCATMFDEECVNSYSIRGGTIFGRHEIHFFDDDEEIVISHSAYSRKPFIRGLMRAVEFMKQDLKAGIYNFEDLTT